MSAFLLQTAGVVLLFCLIEGLDELVRRSVPGRRALFYNLTKIACGLPVVVGAAALVQGAGGALSVPAVGLGCILAAAGLLYFFGPDTRAGDTNGDA